MTANKNLIYYGAAIVIFILLKFFYTMATTNDLAFLLKPTDKLIELSTGSGSNNNTETGYYHSKLNIVIDKSCSGFNFWIICFMMLYFLVLNFLKNTTFKLIAIPVILFLAYILTLFVNTSRILFSVFIHNSEVGFISHSAAWIHQAEGTFIYLSFLIIMYLGFNFLFIKLTNHYAKLA